MLLHPAARESAKAELNKSDNPSGDSSADGSLLDAVLLAAVAALRSLQLPAVAVNEEGAVVPSSETAAAADTQPDSGWAVQPLGISCHSQSHRQSCHRR